MTNYNVNAEGTSKTTYPASLKAGDVLNFFNTSTGYSGTIFNWTVPANGIYRIKAIGASGGGINGYNLRNTTNNGPDGGGGGGFSAGGGSFNKGNNQSTVSGYNRGHGKVEITFVGSANEPPTEPLLTKQPISKSMNLSNEIVPLEWTASIDPEGNPITYEIDSYNGSTWINVASKIIDTNHVCMLPSCDTDKAQFRIRAIDGESNASQYTMSNVFTVVKQIYIVKDGEINKPYKNGAWQLL